MILVIDNYDSFTYNLVQQVEALGENCKVYKNDAISIKEIRRKKPDKIIISPGPGNPDDAGISNAVIKDFYKSVPILGVCLGHQCIGQVFGAQLAHAKKIMHGKTSVISHGASQLFKGLPSRLEVARYHSLALTDVKPPLEITAKSADGTVMALQHERYPVYGVQFHPESFLTENGKQLIRNFVYAKTD